MKGLITKLSIAAWGVGLLASSGCVSYWNFVDPCWPERYNYMARQEVKAGITPQVQNGHILDQTIWNFYFEAGTDKLTPGGLEHLAYIARTRPMPDPVIYLQTAQDVPYDPAIPDKMTQLRAQLDANRIGAIQKYLTAYSECRQVAFQVLVHDPGRVDIAATPAQQSVTRMYAGSQGTLSGGGGGGAPAGGGR